MRVFGACQFNTHHAPSPFGLNPADPACQVEAVDINVDHTDRIFSAMYSLVAYLCAIYATMETEIDKKLVNQIKWLRTAIQSGTITQESVYKATGVHQSQVSRILSGQIKRPSKNVLKVCKYAAHLHISDLPSPLIDTRILSAINQVWDGSSEHAEAIAKVIRSLRGMSVRLPN